MKFIRTEPFLLFIALLAALLALFFSFGRRK